MKQAPGLNRRRFCGPQRQPLLRYRSVYLLSFQTGVKL